MSTTYQVLAWPNEIAATLFVLSLIFTLAPYASGSDFGIFKIPELRDRSKRILRYVGPACLALTLVAFFPLWPPLKLTLTIRLTNKSAEPVSIHRWCNIDIDEPDSDGGVKASYPSYSRELRPLQSTGTSAFIIPPGKTQTFEMTLPIEGSVKDVYERSTGRIQVTFNDRNRKYLGSAAWRLSNRLGGNPALNVDLD